MLDNEPGQRSEDEEGTDRSVDRGCRAGGPPWIRQRRQVWASLPPGTHEEPHHRALTRHQGLRKHETCLLTQIRTGEVGLRAFLFEKGVRAWRSQRQGPRDSRTSVLTYPELGHCRDILRQQQYPRALRTLRKFIKVTANPRRAPSIVHWLLATG